MFVPANVRLYPCDHRFNFMDFFGSFLDHPTTVDPGDLLQKRWVFDDYNFYGEVVKGVPRGILR